MTSKNAGTLAAVGGGLLLMGPIGWAILFAILVIVAIVAFTSGNAKGQGDRARNQEIIAALEARLREVEADIAASKNLAQSVIEKLVKERDDLRAELEQRRRAA